MGSAEGRTLLQSRLFVGRWASAGSRFARYYPHDVVPDGGIRGAVLWWLPSTQDAESADSARAFEELKDQFDAAGRESLVIIASATVGVPTKRRTPLTRLTPAADPCSARSLKTLMSQGDEKSARLLSVKTRWHDAHRQSPV